MTRALMDLRLGIVLRDDLDVLSSAGCDETQLT